jgi:HEPN domain-containing protein
MRPETRMWLEDAEYDLGSAQAMLDSGRLFFVVFMCHLTLEKLLKALVVEREGVEPPRIHNLVALAIRADATIPPEQRQLVNELDNMGVVTRYPDGRRALAKTLTAERASDMYRRTVEFMAWLRQRHSF